MERPAGFFGYRRGAVAVFMPISALPFSRCKAGKAGQIDHKGIRVGRGAWWSPDDAVCCNSRQRVSMCMLPGISGGLLSRSPKIDPSARVETANHQSRDIRPHRVRKRVLDGTGPPSEASPMSMICRKSKIRFRIAGSLVMVKYQILQPEFPYILFNNRRLKTISRIHFKNRQ